MPMEGEALPGYPDVPINGSCTMDKCLARAKEMIGWDEKYPFRDMGNGKVRGVGIAMAMQGSSIAGIDVGGADIKLNEDGSYTLAPGCSDMRNGCDTILAQIQLCHDTYTSSFVQVIAQTPAVSCPQPKGHRKRTMKRNTDAYSPVYHYT